MPALSLTLLHDCKANQSVTLWWRNCDQLFSLFASHEHAIRQMAFFGRSKTCFWLDEDVQDPPIASTILLSFLMSCASGQDDQHKACAPRHIDFSLSRNLHIARHTAKDRDFHINDKHSNHKEHIKATLLFHRRNFHRIYKPYHWIKPDIFAFDHAAATTLDHIIRDFACALLNQSIIINIITSALSVLFVRSVYLQPSRIIITPERATLNNAGTSVVDCYIG